MSESKAKACPCGSTDYEYSFVQFPMKWTAVCTQCQTVTTCTLKPTPPKQPPKPKPPTDYGGYDGMGNWGGF